MFHVSYISSGAYECKEFKTTSHYSLIESFVSHVKTEENHHGSIELADLKSVIYGFKISISRRSVLYISNFFRFVSSCRAGG